MSSFTDRLYSTWVNNNCTDRTRRGCSGYGAEPHGSEAKRREGYPTGLRRPGLANASTHTARRWPTTAASARPPAGECRGPGSCPEKQAAGVPTVPPFLPEPEKSSIKSTS